MKKLRPILAFLITPWVFTYALVLLMAVPFSSNFYHSFSTTLDHLWFLVSDLILYAYLLMSVFGIPVYLILEWRGWRKWWHYLLIGLLVPILPFLIIISLLLLTGIVDFEMLLDVPKAGWPLGPALLFLATIPGLISGFSIWLIVVFDFSAVFPNPETIEVGQGEVGG